VNSSLEGSLEAILLVAVPSLFHALHETRARSRAALCLSARRAGFSRLARFSSQHGASEHNGKPDNANNDQLARDTHDQDNDSNKEDDDAED
jgi:hypothetical protein